MAGAAERRTLRKVDDTGFSRGDSVVVAGRNGQRKDAIADFIEIDLDLDGLGVLLVLIRVFFAGIFLIVFGCVVLLILVGVGLSCRLFWLLP